MVNKRAKDTSLVIQTAGATTIQEPFVQETVPPSKRRQDVKIEITCDKCDETLCSKQVLKLCMKREDNDEIQFRCNIEGCLFKGKTQFNLSVHKKRVHIVKIFHCNLCNFSTSTQETLASHHKRNHCKARKYPCDQCPYRASNSRHLGRHTRSKHNVTHSKIPQFSRWLCDYSSNIYPCAERHDSEKHSGEKIIDSTEKMKDKEVRKVLEGNSEELSDIPGNKLIIKGWKDLDKIDPERSLSHIDDNEVVASDPINNVVTLNTVNTVVVGSSESICSWPKTIDEVDMYINNIIASFREVEPNDSGAILNDEVDMEIDNDDLEFYDVLGTDSIEEFCSTYDFDFDNKDESFLNIF